MPVLAEGMFFPVDIVMQPIPERSLKMAVFAQTFVIDHDLPSAQQVSGQVSAMQENFL